ncbi:MAG: histidine--tRNA ligase [Burkholderiaceae bacterium]|nr:histidine--tRNA ligase [Burkholderiaceae bacterium]
MSKVDRIQGVRGMNDVLPADEALWDRLESTVAATMRAYGYARIRTPIVEPTRLFVRGLGEVTDIVEKEMYSFVDSLNGDELSLRPENTAGVVRAALEHNLTYESPRRLWYAGPMFRHERPQKGRYRQFHQIGAEALGFAGPDVDAELIMLCRRLWDDLGLPQVRLEINSLGQADERAAHRQALISYLEGHRDLLDEDARRRLHSNPLRILDTKNPAMQEIAENAPRLAEFLGEASRAHFDGLTQRLRDLNQPYHVNHRLVRGLDYYNLTVFEWVADGLTLCGGGRYDPLVEMLGGRASPSCGFALGVERVLELLRQHDLVGEGASPDCYVVHQGDAAAHTAIQVAERLRDAGLDVVMHCGSGGFKSQFKRADASRAAFAIVLGDDEVAKGVAAVKSLRGGQDETGKGEQQSVALEDLADFVLGRLADEPADDANGGI